MSDDLLPCPFCGGAAFCSEYGDGRVIIGCGNDACLVEASMCDTPAAAIAAWNRRALPATDAREKALLHRAAQLAYEVWDDPEALAKAILALIDKARDD